MKKALITGITGQDGSYLAEFLLEKGYEVHGIYRRTSVSNMTRIGHIMDEITLHNGDLSDSSGLIRIIGLVQPDEIYNLAAQSHVQVSFDVPEYSGDVDAVAKLYGFWITREYREAYHMFAVNGILFNHESERRGENFVTREITLAAGRIAEGIQDHLDLGNLDSLRDWGYAKDYVECMWLMLQQDKPEDLTSYEELVEIMAKHDRALAKREKAMRISM